LGQELQQNGYLQIALYQSNPQAIPRSRFAIALYQSNLRAIPRSRFAIALYQSNLQAIALPNTTYEQV
jgi:hypothetical protein